MTRLGYIRFGARDSDCDAEVALLETMADKIVRCETRVGSMRVVRAELGSIVRHMQVGDELVVIRLDHIARSAREVLEIVQEIASRGASLRILEPELTTSNGMDKPIIAALNIIADLERKVAKDRQRAGIDAGRAAGSYKGRIKSVDDDEIRRRVAAGESKTAIARDMDICRMTIYRAIGAVNNGVADAAVQGLSSGN